MPAFFPCNQDTPFKKAIPLSLINDVSLSTIDPIYYLKIEHTRPDGVPDLLIIPSIIQAGLFKKVLMRGVDVKKAGVQLTEEDVRQVKALTVCSYL